MKVSKWVDMGAEVEIDIDMHDIRSAMAEAFERTEPKLFEELPNIHDILRAHDDALLEKCAAIADELSSFKSQIGPQHGMGVCWAAKTIADKIRALKECR